jgi:hypothetical protein
MSHDFTSICTLDVVVYWKREKNYKTNVGAVVVAAYISQSINVFFSLRLSFESSVSDYKQMSNDEW